jgi:hypothetical protein
MKGRGLFKVNNGGLKESRGLFEVEKSFKGRSWPIGGGKGFKGRWWPVRDYILGFV